MHTGCTATGPASGMGTPQWRTSTDLNLGGLKERNLPRGICLVLQTATGILSDGTPEITGVPTHSCSHLQTLPHKALPSDWRGPGLSRDVPPQNFCLLVLAVNQIPKEHPSHGPLFCRQAFRCRKNPGKVQKSPHRSRVDPIPPRGS